MIPGRSLSAKTIGRSIAPVARTTSRARRCQSRSRARGEAPGTPRRRSCGDDHVLVEPPDRRASAAGTGSPGLRAASPGAARRMAGLQQEHPPAGGHRLRRRAAIPAAPAPTTTTSAWRQTCSPGVSSISGTGAFPDTLRTASPSTSSTSVARPKRRARARRRSARSAPRRPPPRSRAAVRGRCCARPRPRRSRAVRTRRCRRRSPRRRVHRT